MTWDGGSHGLATTIVLVDWMIKEEEEEKKKAPHVESEPKALSIVQPQQQKETNPFNLPGNFEKKAGHKL